jgi:hypothetical protein
VEARIITRRSPVYTNTNANIPWIRESLPTFAKIGAHWYARRKFFASYTSKELQENWSYVQKRGFFSVNHELEMEERVCSLLPDFKDYYVRNSEHHNTLGYTLVHRAGHSLSKNEMARFRNKTWAPVYALVAHATLENKVIEPRDRYAIHERIILSRAGGVPGVYLRVDPECTGWMYLGEAQNVLERQRGHSNSPLVLVRVYVTQDKRTALDLQNSLFRKLEESGLIRRRMRPESPIGRQGALQLASGVNPLATVDGIVNNDYKEFCRMTLGIREVHLC